MGNMKYYIGTLEEVQQINEQIKSNSGIPDQLGTENWAIPRETINSGIFAIPVPTNGWDGHNYEQMVFGIAALEISDVKFPITEE